MLRITPKNLLIFSECSYKSRQPKGGPAPFASFEDLSDYLGEDKNALKQTSFILLKDLNFQLQLSWNENTETQINISFTADDTSPEEIVPLPGKMVNGSPSLHL